MIVCNTISKSYFPFIVVHSQIKTRSGEKVIDYLAQVEDTKGNNGERGEIHARLRYQLPLIQVKRGSGTYVVH